MDAELLYIDAAGRLYRGYGRQWPILLWQPASRLWAKSDLPTPQDWDWGELITEREAERCYPGSTKAPLPEGTQTVLHALDVQEMMRYRPEIFDDYDFGCTPRKSPEEEAEDRARFERSLPEETRLLLTRRRAQVQVERARIRSKGKNKGP